MSYQTGYGVEVPKSGGVYLRLKEKGEKVRLRLVSDPIHFHDVIKGGNKDGSDKIVSKVGWLAIHKYVENGKPAKKAVCFQSGPMVYGLVKDLAENPEWGDPKLYDIEIVRTEESGKYYTVAPLPKPIGPISAEEQKIVDEANLDLVKLCVKEGVEAPAAKASEDEPEDIFADE